MNNDISIHIIDWIIILSYILFSLGVGLYYNKRAASSTKEYFLSGGLNLDNLKNAMNNVNTLYFDISSACRHRTQEMVEKKISKEPRFLHLIICNRLWAIQI